MKERQTFMKQNKWYLFAIDGKWGNESKKATGLFQSYAKRQGNYNAAIDKDWGALTEKAYQELTTKPKTTTTTPKTITKVTYTTPAYNQRDYQVSNRSAYVCGLVAFANILASFGLISAKKSANNGVIDTVFKKTIDELFDLCKTQTNSSGTSPANLLYGCNKYLAKHKLNYEFITVPFKANTYLSDTFNILKSGGRTLINYKTDTSIGYKAKKESKDSFGHWSAVVGADTVTKQVNLVDSNHIPSVSVPKWYNSSLIGGLIAYNGNRPIYVLRKKK